MPPTFSKMCQHVKMSNFSLSRVSITRASSRVRAVVHTSLRCRGHRKVLREGKGEGTKTRGLGERKRGKEEEPVIIFLNTSCRPLFPKCVNMSKCLTFHCHGFRLLALVRLSIHRFDVAGTERFSGFGISTLTIL